MDASVNMKMTPGEHTALVRALESAFDESMDIFQLGGVAANPARVADADLKTRLDAREFAMQMVDLLAKLSPTSYVLTNAPSHDTEEVTSMPDNPTTPASVPEQARAIIRSAKLPDGKYGTSRGKGKKIMDWRDPRLGH